MSKAIAVIGCGRMGSSLVRALAGSGQRIVAWDQSDASLQQLRSESVEIASSLQDAVTSADVVLFCLPTYNDVTTCLMSLNSLAGVTVVNMGEGTAKTAEAMHDVVVGLGGGYLDAEILTRPEEIGSDTNIILIAGEERLWTAVRDRIGVLAGDFKFVSSYIGGACALVLGVMGSFVVAGAVALMEGARYAKLSGVKLDVYLSLLDSSMPIFREIVREGFAGMDSGNYASEAVSIEVGYHSADTFLSGLRERGMRGDMLEAALARFKEGIDLGIGDLGLFALDASNSLELEASAKG